MKKFLVAVMFGLMAIAAQAEATFEQIEGLIQQKNYAAAASGLEVIIQNHPKSSKAFYAMAQAQAGLGNLEKANKALTIATGLNPTLDFAPEGSVKKLKDAITPQTAKIEYIEESNALRNFILFAMFAGFGVALYFVWGIYNRKKDEEDARETEEAIARHELRADALREQERQRQEARAKEIKAEEELKSHKNYSHERFDPANPNKLKSVAQFKKEQQEAAQAMALREAEIRAARAEDEARIARGREAYARANSTPSPTVVHTNNSSTDMLTGVLIGNMLSSSHHDTTRVVEREVIREVPAKSSSRDSSWDDTPSTPSRSSSWDDTPSRSSSSSSWDSGSSSSSSSSSSWDSGSSSSDSGSSSSSSSWD